MIKVKDLIGEEHIDYEIYRSDNLIKQPAVSVLMPTYCRGDNGLLRRAIRSVLSQSFASFELIIIDDGSVDRTRQVIEQAMKKDRRIVYIRNHQNSGLPSVKVMQGFQLARAEYIAYQFDDDRWYPDALETMVGFIRKQSRSTFAYGACDYIKMMDGQKLVLGDKNVSFSDIFRVNTIPNNTVIHHREMFERYGSYDPHLFLRRLTDWDLWKRWIESGATIKRIPKVLSIVEEQRAGSLYTTFDSDIALTRIIGAGSFAERNPALCVPDYYDYEIDDLSFIPDEELRHQLYCKKIKPYYEKYPDRIRKIRQREFQQENRKKTLMIAKKNYAVGKDRLTDKLLQGAEGLFGSFYMQSEHIELDPSAIDYADASVLIGEKKDFTHEALRIIAAKPYIWLSEKESLGAEWQQELIRRLERQKIQDDTVAPSKEEANEERPKSEPPVSASSGELSEEQIDLLSEKNRVIEEQAILIAQLQRQAEQLMGYAGEDDLGDIRTSAVDISDLCDDYDRLRFDKKTKLIRHLSRADYEGNRLYREFIERFRQEDYLRRRYYLGFSSFLSEIGEELIYPIDCSGGLPESISVVATNYNPVTKVVVALLQIIDADNRIIAQTPLRGVDLCHKTVTKIPLRFVDTLDCSEEYGDCLLRFQPQYAARFCGISFLEWKIRAWNGKIKDKQLCMSLQKKS